MATEIVRIVDPDMGSGYHYDSISDWEVDLGDSTNWSGTWTDNASWMHWIFTNSALSGTGFRINLVTKEEKTDLPSNFLAILPEGDGGGSGDQWWGDNASPAWDYDAVNLKDYIGQWVRIEFKMQISGVGNDVTLTMWVGDAAEESPTVGPCTGPGQNGSAFTKIIFSAWENSSYAHDADYYIDDILIADSYIGPNILGKINGVRGDQVKKVNGVYTDVLSKMNGYTIQGS